jgi:hypothetical protein
VDPGDLAAQHGILVAQHQQFGILVQVSSQLHRGQTEQRTHQPVHDRQQQHPTMIHDLEPCERRRPVHRIELSSPTGCWCVVAP